MTTKDLKIPSLNRLTTGYYCLKNSKSCKKCQYLNKFGVKRRSFSEKIDIFLQIESGIYTMDLFGRHS